MNKDLELIEKAKKKYSKFTFYRIELDTVRAETPCIFLDKDVVKYALVPKEIWTRSGIRVIGTYKGQGCFWQQSSNSIPFVSQQYMEILFKKKILTQLPIVDVSARITKS